jgi:hypothetical protein
MEMKGAGLNPGNQKPCERNPGVKPALNKYLQGGFSGNKEVPE